MRHMDIRYYFVHDLVQRGMVSVEHCGASDMIGDFNTKPLQGQLFKNFRNSVLGSQ